MDKQNQMKRVDLTPTYAGTVRICLTLLEQATTEEAKQAARDELIKLGNLLDEVIK